MIIKRFFLGFIGFAMIAAMVPMSVHFVSAVTEIQNWTGLKPKTGLLA